MDSKALIFEIYRETEFIKGLILSRMSETEAAKTSEYQSVAAIAAACGAHLNGEALEPYIEHFVRKELETQTVEELDIYGKFSPPPGFVRYSDLEEND
ncbi:MAG TPA: hypothetical protein DER02_00060 [Gammaproteobacteria bacterium]|nr:hypothetical protein [Gammaproteobacteria bacterium]|tara:strand:- start:2852 stop:3145 length:294 start_codon:yes stop_codon:yes gene_type:complete